MKNCLGGEVLSVFVYTSEDRCDYKPSRLVRPKKLKNDLASDVSIGHQKGKNKLIMMSKKASEIILFLGISIFCL